MPRPSLSHGATKREEGEDHHSSHESAVLIPAVEHKAARVPVDGLNAVVAQPKGLPSGIESTISSAREWNSANVPHPEKLAELAELADFDAINHIAA